VALAEVLKSSELRKLQKGVRNFTLFRLFFFFSCEGAEHSRWTHNPHTTEEVGGEEKKKEVRMNRGIVLVKNLGRMSYHESYAIQENLFNLRRMGQGRDTLFLVEHSDSVYTMGKKDSHEDILDEGQLLKDGHKILKVNRGGRGIFFSAFRFFHPLRFCIEE
jgi:hypothetical protein